MKNRLFAAMIVLLLGTGYVYASPSSISENICDPQTADNIIMGNENLSVNCVDGVFVSNDSHRIGAGNLAQDLKSGSSKDNKNAFLGESNIEGLAAGNHLAGWGFWGSFSYTNFDGDNNLKPTAATAVTKLIFEADTRSFLFGADRLVTDQLVLGLAAGYEDTTVETLFNGGTNDSDGYTIAPYAAYLINDTFSVDAAFGYSSLEYDAERLELTTASVLNADYDSDRWFFTTNFNASTTYNDWYLSGRLGWLYSDESQDGYTETGGTAGGARTVGDRDLWISQIIVGGDATYSFGQQEVYFGAAYVHDLSRGLGTGAGGLPGGVEAIFDDDDEVQFNAGVRLYASRFTAILDFNHVVNRDNFDSTGVMFTIRTDL